MNRERIEHKRRAWDDGAWVREAAAAHAAKRREHRLAQQERLRRHPDEL